MSMSLKLPATVVLQSLFEGALGRPLASADLDRYIAALEAGSSLTQMVDDICASDEFKTYRKPVDPLVVKLPDLTALYPERYRRLKDGTTLYDAVDNRGIAFMEGLISSHRYYDSFGIWVPIVDQDKRITAALIQALGASSCVELGCFAGAALSVLKEAGVDVCGVEVSHRAFILASDAVHENLKYGDLLDVNLNRQFDAFLGMDILEHLSPLKLDQYVSKIRSLLKPDGFAYINSPMFGTDRIFGTAFSQYIPEWRAMGDSSYNFVMHCDEMGWPAHGHLVWASPKWWENMFARNGLFRDEDAERLLHDAMGDWLDAKAPARRSLFVLREKGAKTDLQSLEAGIETYLRPQLTA